MRITIPATECMDELNRLDSLVAKAAGHDMNNYQGLDIDEEFEYDQNLVNDVGKEFEAIVQKNQQADEPNWGGGIYCNCLLRGVLLCDTNTRKRNAFVTPITAVQVDCTGGKAS